jgi:hypothetical protein
VNDVTFCRNCVTLSGSKVITFEELIIYMVKTEKMKKTIFTMAAIAFFAVTASTSFGQNIDKKTDKTKEVATKQDLKVAQKDSVADYQNFKKESEAKILNNEKSLADSKLKVSKSNLNYKADYEKRLTTLNQKNVDLKKRLADYKQNGETKWSSFKTGYNNDMVELEKELKSFTVENKKVSF